MSLKKHFTLWKPPSSKAMKLTEQDTLFTEGIIEFVEKYYYDNVRYEKGSRINDEKNNSDAKYEIHNFGDSWTYGWCLENEEAYPHLLIEEDVASYNYGAGRTGLDYAVKKASEVYHNRGLKDKDNFVFVMTIPHTFRRMFVEDDGMARRCIEKPKAALINEYNH